MSSTPKQHRTLNEAAVNVIAAIQSLRKFAIHDVCASNKKDWFTRCTEYWSEIPDELMAAAGLLKNRYDLDRVLDFELTTEIMDTSYADLGRFSLD